MVNRKQFQEWLNKFPEDTIIEIAIQEEPHGYDSYGKVKFKSPNLERVGFDNESGDGWEYINFEGNRFIKEDDKMYNKKILYLGEDY